MKPPMRSLANHSDCMSNDAINTKRKLTRMATRAPICLELNDLLMCRTLHEVNAAVSGSVNAFVTIDIDGRMAERPKTNNTLPVKSQKAGYTN